MEDARASRGASTTTREGEDARLLATASASEPTRGVARAASGTTARRDARRWTWTRVAVGACAACAIAGGGIWARRRAAASGWPDATAAMSPKRVRDALDAVGPLAIVIYVVGFALAELCHLPALVFVAAGVVKWGKFVGWLTALAMAPISCAFSFVVIRRIGGEALLTKINWRAVRTMLARLERHPVGTVIALRTVLFLSPSINYALALTKISLRDFFVGSALGLVAPLTLVVLLIDHLMTFYGWDKEAL